MQRLVGRRAIVTGGAQGIGRAVAVALAEAGARVVAADRSPAVVDEVHPNVRGVVVDVSVPDAVRTFVDDAAAHLGGLDIVVNNAGSIEVSHPVHSTWEDSVATFEALVGDNYASTFLVGRASVPHLLAATADGRPADIVNVTTDHLQTCGYPEVLDHSDAPDCPYAHAPRPPVGSDRVDVYDSTKWAVKGLTLVWATALAPYGVRVNSVGMGATATPMYLGRRGERGPEPGTMQPADVAAVIVDLIVAADRTGDQVPLWIGHPCRLGPPGLDARSLGL